MTRSLMLLVSCLVPLAAHAEMPADGFDIGGLRFGMTPEKAAETIAAYDSRMKVETARARITSYNVCYTKLLRLRPLGRGRDLRLGRPRLRLRRHRGNHARGPAADRLV